MKRLVSSAIEMCNDTLTHDAVFSNDLGEPIGMAELDALIDEAEDDYTKMWVDINKAYENGIV